MTQEEKDLLLKDLCARLPYGVHIYNKMNNSPISARVMLDYYHIRMLNQNKFDFINPYLFPLSSMTEEQKKEYRKVCELDTEILSKHPMDETPFPALYHSQDWLDKNHFDYRGLIPMGLAIDATRLNIY